MLSEKKIFKEREIRSYVEELYRILSDSKKGRTLVLDPRPLFTDILGGDVIELFSSIDEALVLGNANSVVGDPFFLPFTDSSYNSCLSIFLLNSYDEQFLKKSIKEIFRILNDGGIFCGVLKLRDARKEREKPGELLNRFFEKVGILYFPSIERISFLLTEAGFSEVSVEIIPGKEIDELSELHKVILEGYVRKTGNKELRKISEEFSEMLLRYGECNTTLSVIKALKGAKS